MDKIVKLCARRATAQLATALFTAIVTTQSARAAEFIPLGSVPGERLFSRTLRVSDDGGVVVGFSDHLIWTRELGLQNINDVIGGERIFGTVTDVSGDGSTFLGFAVTGAFRWSETDGLLIIEDGLEDGPFHAPLAISDDGTAFVGAILDEDGITSEAFRWSDFEGLERLGRLPGVGLDSRALGVSADGNVVVGISEIGLSTSDFEAFRWTRETGMVGLGDLAGGDHHSSANAVSPDGSVVIGQASSSRGSEAVRWTAGAGMELLGNLPDGTPPTTARGVSNHGEIIVGGSPVGGFIWDADHGPRLLMDLLIDSHGLGEELEGWQFGSALDISPDGNSVVGNGINPAGESESWLVIIPEPSGLILAAIAVVILSTTRNRCSKRS